MAATVNQLLLWPKEILNYKMQSFTFSWFVLYHVLCFVLFFLHRMVSSYNSSLLMDKSVWEWSCLCAFLFENLSGKTAKLLPLWVKKLNHSFIHVTVMMNKVLLKSIPFLFPWKSSRNRSYFGRTCVSEAVTPTSLCVAAQSSFWEEKKCLP